MAWGHAVFGQTRPALALIHVNVIDGTGSPVLSNRTVVILNDRIASVNSEDTLPLPKSTQVVDASGKYLIPGLWDMHVHMRGSRNGSSQDFASQNAALLPLYLANGVTGVRETGGDLVSDVLEWRAQIPAGGAKRARVLSLAVPNWTALFRSGRGRSRSQRLSRHARPSSISRRLVGTS